MDQSTLQSLLEKLRSSTAYADALATTHAPEHPSPSEPSPFPPGPSPREAQHDDSSEALVDSTGVSSRISSLLSRLRPQAPEVPETEQSILQVPEPKAIDHVSEEMALDTQNENQSLDTPKHKPSVDYRTLTYVESLSRVEELLKDPRTAALLLDAVSSSFSTRTNVLRKLKKAQDEMETKLWDGRQALKRKHEEKVRAAKTTARIVTGSEQLDEKETQRLLDELSRSEREHDLKHVLPAWDALLHKQQVVMERLGVPAMFHSTDPTERARQQRIVRVMEQGLMEGS
ncbi:hypothetical protein FRC04_010883 [Tulasnella sp. 424]|nr:hypothetical protein FRC04_010883 [Tulasnella sp. 424]